MGEVPAVRILAKDLSEEAVRHSFGHTCAGRLGTMSLEVLGLLAVGRRRESQPNQLIRELA